MHTPFEIEFSWGRCEAGYEERGEEIVMANPKTMQQIRPTEMRPDLYLRFAGIKDTPAAIIEFASLYGLPGMSDLREQISVIKNARRAMQHLIERKTNFPKKSPLDFPEMPLAHTDVVMRTDKDGNASLYLRPRSLLDAMMVQYAKSLLTGGDFVSCQYCDAPLAIQGRGRKRRDTKFCDANCKAAWHYYGRKKGEQS